MATIAELLQMGYDPQRMAQGRIGGPQYQSGPQYGLSDAELTQIGYDPNRVSQGDVRGLQQSSADSPVADQQLMRQPAPQEFAQIQQQAQQPKLRDLSQIRNLPPNLPSQQNSANPIDNPRVEVPSGTGMIRNNRTGATYSLNTGAPQANDVALDYSRPIEIYGQGKGYAIKGQPLAAMIDGRRVDYGVDRAATNAEQDRQLAIADKQATIGQKLAATEKMTQGMAAAPKESPRELAAYKFGLKQLERDEKEIEQAAAIENAAKRWQQLNQNVETGRFMGMMPAIGNPERQELEQIQNFMTLNNFKPGQGAISNVEREYMKGAGPSLMNDRQTNDNITQIMIGAAQNARDRAIFRQTWLENNRSLSGADAAWQKYVDSNPRFMPQKNGTIVENQRRVPPEEFFGLTSTQPATPQQLPAGAHPLDAFRTR